MRAARQTEELLQAPTPSRRRRGPKTAGPDATPADSPALALQADISARWDMETELDAEYSGPRWSPRRMLALAGGVSLVLWLAIGLGVNALIGS